MFGFEVAKNVKWRVFNHLAFGCSLKRHRDASAGNLRKRLKKRGLGKGWQHLRQVRRPDPPELGRLDAREFPGGSTSHSMTLPKARLRSNDRSGEVDECSREVNECSVEVERMLA